MVLYHAITTYQLLECIEHKILEHPNEEGVLLIPTFFYEKMPEVKVLEKRKIFKKVIDIPYQTIKNNEKTMKQETMKLFSEYFKYNIKEISDINICGYQYFITIFLIENQVPFNIFEEAPGGFSRKEKLEEVDKRIHEARYKFIKENGLYDLDNKLIRKKYCICGIQLKEFKRDDVIDFDPIEKFSKLKVKDQKSIKEIFKCPDEIEVENNTALILTNHLHNLGILTFEQHVEIYQMFVDYFLENKRLIFKLHPDDIMPYQEIFPLSTSIKEKFPSEILPFIFKRKPETLATISSTGFFQLEKYFDHGIRIGFEYEETYKKTHQYYIITQILDKLGIQNIDFWNADENLLLELFKVNKMRINAKKIKSLKDKKYQCILIDRCESYENTDIDELLSNLRENEIIFFLNSQHDFGCWKVENKKILEKIEPISIKIEYRTGEIREEISYVYTSNLNIRRKINQMSINKKLKYEQAEIKKECLSKEEIRIKVLEGMLEATEKRLKYYIKKENETL